MSDLVPSEAAIRAFEALKQGRVEGLFAPGLLTGEQIIAGLLLRLTQQQDALYQALTGRPSPAPSPTAPMQVVVAVSFDLSATNLNAILSLVPELRGYIADSVSQFPVLVPAGGSATVLVPPPQGYVAILLSPMQVTTTDVGAGVSVQVTVDGHNVIGPQGFVLGPGASIVAGQYNVAVDTGVEVTLTNPSAANVTVYFHGQLRVMARAFYDKFFAPLETKGYEAVRAAFGLG